MLKLITKFIVFLVFAMMMPMGRVQAEEIKEFVVFMKIDAEARLHVAEKISYDFGAETRYGIYRYLPIKYQDGFYKYNLRLEEIEVPEYKFVTSRVGDKLLIKIGEEGKALTGLQFYGINYSVSKAFAYSSDRDELSWQVTGNGWPVGIKLARAEIDLPRALPAEQVIASCTVGPVEKIVACANWSLVKNDAGLVTGIAFTQKNLQATEGLAIKLSLPKGVLDRPGVWDWIRGNYLVLLFVTMIMGAVFRWRKFITSKLKFNK